MAIKKTPFTRLKEEDKKPIATSIQSPYKTEESTAPNINVQAPLEPKKDVVTPTATDVYQEALQTAETQKANASSEAYVLNEQARMYADNLLKAQGLGNQGVAETTNVSMHNAYMNALQGVNKDYNQSVNQINQEFAVSGISDFNNRIDNAMQYGDYDKVQSLYQEMLQNPNLTAQQRNQIQDQYDYASRLTPEMQNDYANSLYQIRNSIEDVGLKRSVDETIRKINSATSNFEAEKFIKELNQQISGYAIDRQRSEAVKADLSNISAFIDDNMRGNIQKAIGSDLFGKQNNKDIEFLSKVMLLSENGLLSEGSVIKVDNHRSLKFWEKGWDVTKTTAGNREYKYFQFRNGSFVELKNPTLKDKTIVSMDNISKYINNL